MAQNAKIAALTDELIHSILKFDPQANKQAYKQAKDLASKGLKAHQYARTNQFDVQASFRGLDEKFRVLNRDDLADALGSRLKELDNRNKWVPEYLSLLLRLSNRPVENSQVEALELLRPPSPQPPLTWAEIIADDPLSDEDIWKDIDYAAESSEDEISPKKRDKSRQTPPSSVDEGYDYDPAACLVPVDVEAVRELGDAQFWRKRVEERTANVHITELQAIRETLHMLAGLQTSLFVINRENTTIRVSHRYTVDHAMSKTVEHLLVQLSDIGRDLLRLRQWSCKPTALPLVQTLESAIRTRLTEYDRYLAGLHQTYLVPKQPIAVSLLDVHDKVRASSGPLLRLAALVVDMEPVLLVNPFAHLEALYEQINIVQMTLEKELFDFFAKLFFECLQTYLKPIRRWMESGELGANDETFFVFENDSASEAASLWHDRYVLRRGRGNALRSPSFLQPAAQRIFNTGKSVVFLKELGIYNTQLGSPGQEPRLDYQTVCGILLETPLSPFSELFRFAFDDWIGSKYSLASTVLREHLFLQCGLLNILKDFEAIYLGANGAVFQEFADAIFERMDSGLTNWNDRFLLTELARGTFSIILGKANAEKIVVRTTRMKSQGRSVKELSSLSLDYALLWPVMNIIQRSSIPVYQQLFTFLLQAYRAKYLLQDVSLKHLTRTKRSHKLRHRLIWFADTLRSYLAETIISPSFKHMLTAMSKADDIDEMSSVHLKYLAQIQEQALLSENLKPIHRAVISLLDLSIAYADAHDQSARPTSPSAPAKRPAPSRRKSVVPAIAEDESSDNDNSSSSDANHDRGLGKHAPASGAEPSFDRALETVDRQFGELLPFVTAGLRSVGRVGAEPVWEMLAERLEWERGKGRGGGFV